MKGGTFLLKFFVSFLSVLIALTFFEFGLRHLPHPDPVPLLENDPEVRIRYRKNLSLQIQAENLQGTIPFQTNNLGFVGENWTVDTSSLRIAHFGDSFTAASNISFRKNYVSQINDLLVSRLPFSLQSFNFGVGGYSTQDSLRSYRVYQKQVKPNIVVLWMYLGNDLNDNYTPPFSTEENISPAVLEIQKESFSFKKFIYSLELTKLVKNALVRSGLGHAVVETFSHIPFVGKKIYPLLVTNIPSELLVGFSQDPRSVDSFLQTEKYVTKFFQETQKAGQKFFVILIPPHFQVDPNALDLLKKQYPDLKQKNFNPDLPEQQLSEFFQKSGIPFYDLTPRFKQKCEHECTLYMCRYCHLSEQGYTVAAQEVSDFLFRVITSPL